MKRQAAVFYVLIVLALGAIAALVFLLGPGTVPQPPPVVLASAEPQENGVAPAPGTDIDSRILTVDVDSVQNVIATLQRAEAYSRTLTAVNLWDGGSATTAISVWVLGEDTRISLRPGGTGPEKNVLLRGEDKWIWYSDRPGVWQGPAESGDADAYQSLLTYETLLSLDRSAILDAGFGDYDGEFCIFVRYIEGSLGYESLCHISVATGLLMGVETYDGEKLVFALSSSRPSLTAPEPTLFELPASA